MRRRFLLSIALALTAALPACGQYTTHVEADEVALGRVVVYRNGIAYYERRAKVDGDKLTMKVPADKVDDFLKSLTVADAKTGAALPVAFPSRGGNTSGSVDMTIQLPDKRHRDIILTYVTEAPAWKPSYRVVVDDAGKVNLQGWAVVDNTSGEDWTAVKVGVGSSSALSFRYDLHSIRLVHRETLTSQDTFAKAPPRGGSVFKNEVTGDKEMVLAEVGDLDIPRPAGHPDVAEAEEPSPPPMVAQAEASNSRSARGGASYGAGASGYSAKPAAKAPMRYKLAAEENTKDASRDDSKLSALAAALRGRGAPVVIEGYADAGEADGQERALDRANLMRNQLVQKGVPPAQLKVAARGVVAGQRAGVRLVEEKSQVAANGRKPTAEEDAGTPVGESHFESKSAMTVGKGTSAMVSILQGQAPGEIVYLYDSEGDRGNKRFAFRSVRFRNPTTSTLESGPMTVYGSGRFIGEGLSDPIPPGATAVVPFALDRQVVVDREGSTGDRMSRLIKLNRGVLTAEVQHLRTTKLKITNRLHTATVVHVRHNIPKGWTLTKGPKVAEQYAESRLFAVEFAAGETKLVEIEEMTPMVRTVDLRSPIGVDLVKVYLQTAKEEPHVAASMDKLLKLYQEMANHRDNIDSLRQRGDEFRVRANELHEQIFSLKLVKTGGPLMAHLGQKMKETSQKVQENTIAIVEQQENLMLAKVRFHDELAEMSLEKKVAGI